MASNGYTFAQNSLMNKYKAQSQAAQKKRKLEKMCLNKKAFNSPEEAEQKNQRVYQCPNCKKWHRSGAEMRLIRQVEKK
jgi:hypothetical protein